MRFLIPSARTTPPSLPCRHGLSLFNGMAPPHRGRSPGVTSWVDRWTARPCGGRRGRSGRDDGRTWFKARARKLLPTPTGPTWWCVSRKRWSSRPDAGAACGSRTVTGRRTRTARRPRSEPRTRPIRHHWGAVPGWTALTTAPSKLSFQLIAIGGTHQRVRLRRAQVPPAGNPFLAYATKGEPQDLLGLQHRGLAIGHAPLPIPVGPDNVMARDHVVRERSRTPSGAGPYFQKTDAHAFAVPDFDGCGHFERLELFLEIRCRRRILLSLDLRVMHVGTSQSSNQNIHSRPAVLRVWLRPRAAPPRSEGGLRK